MKEQLMSSPKMGGKIEFLGELDSTFLAYSDLSSILDVTEGTLNTGIDVDKWFHFILDNRTLIVSKIPIRYSISWNHLYSKGLVYGTNDNGKYPVGTPTNQLRTIIVSGKTYNVRLLKGGDEDPTSSPNYYDSVGTQNSEWSRLFYPIVVDPYISSYTGPKLAEYTNNTLGFHGGIACFNWCQESLLKSPSTYRVLKGGTDSVAFLTGYTSSYIDVSRSWRPCLELIP